MTSPDTDEFADPRIAELEAEKAGLHARIRDLEVRNQNLRTRSADAVEGHQLAIAEIRRLERDVDWQRARADAAEKRLNDVLAAATELMPARRRWRGWGGG